MRWIWTECYRVYGNSQLAARAQRLKAQELLKDSSVQIVLPFGDVGSVDQIGVCEIKSNHTMFLAREQAFNDSGAFCGRQNWISDVESSIQIGILQSSNELAGRDYVTPLPCHNVKHLPLIVSGRARSGGPST